MNQAASHEMDIIHIKDGGGNSVQQSTRTTCFFLVSLSVMMSLAFATSYASTEPPAVATTSETDQRILQLTMDQAVELTLTNSPQIILEDLSVREAELNLKSAQVNLRITVTPQQLEDAQAALDAAVARAQLTRQAQAQAAREQYINVLKAQHTLVLANASVERAERRLAVMRERHSAGMATDIDLYLAENGLRRAQMTRRQSEAELTSQRIGFNQLLSRDLHADFELVDNVVYETPAWDLETDTENALINRLDIRIQTRALELAERNLIAADPSYTPQAQIERLQMAVDRASIGLDRLKTQVILETRDAILRLETTRLQAELASEALEHQKQQLQVANLRHDSGLITAADLMDAQATADEAEVQAVQTMYDLALAVTRYLNTIGATTLPAPEN